MKTQFNENEIAESYENGVDVNSEILDTGAPKLVKIEKTSARSAEVKRREAKLGVDLTQGPPMKQFLRYALPVVLMGLLTACYNSADAIVLGQFAGKLAFSAVGASTAIMGLIVGSVTSLNVGVAVLTAKAFGAGDDAQTKKIVGTAVVFGASIGLIFMVIGEILSPLMLQISGCPPEVYDQALLYLRIYFAGVPAQLFYSSVSPLLTARGDSKRPLLYMSISGVVNVMLNVLFVAVLKIEVAGVAIATIISQTLAVIMLLTRLLKINDASRLVIREIRVNKFLLIQMLMLGIPSVISSASYSITNFMIQSGVNSFGPDSIAGNSAAGNIDTYIFTIVNTLTTATVTAIGQNYGAGNKKRVMQMRRAIHLLASVSIIIISWLAIFFSEPLLSIFVPGEPQALVYGKTRMICILSLVVFYTIATINGGVLQAFGKTAIQMIVTLVCVCGTRVVWMLFIYPLNKTSLMLYLGYPVGYVILIVVSTVVTGLFLRRYKRSPSAIGFESSLGFN